jgi:O-6-methylguanine DNA methyltransferase
MDNSIFARPDVQAPAGFTEAVLRKTGLLDRYTVVRTVLGQVYVAVSDHGITSIAQADDDAAFLAQYHEQFGRRAERRDDLAPDLEELINEHGDAADVDLRGCNAFQRDVLEAARRIPEGAVRPYRWIAEAIGRPGAVRAVGTALARNPVPLVVPCHRVVRSDGAAGEYAFGAHAKVELLEHEQVDLAEVQRRMNLRAVWSEAGESTYCRPYCFEARPLQSATLRQFKTDHEAESHGLTPCTTCHPARAA